MPVFSDVLIGEMYVFLMIFMRVGSALMVLPGYGEIFVNPRARLVLALMVSLVVTPLLGPTLPPMPASMPILVIFIIKEIMVGVFIGMMVRILISAMHSAATILAAQSGLANAMMFDFTMSGQATSVSNLLSFAALVLIFTADLHHIMLQGVVDSYYLLPTSKIIPAQDMAYTLAMYVNKAFYVALKLSTPFIAMALITNVGAGVLSRLMPNFQVFFVLMGPQIWVTFIVLLISLPSIMLWYLSYVEDGLSSLLVAL